MLDFEHCEMTAMMGRTRTVQVPLPRGTASRVPQIESLEEWAALLKLGMVVAVRAAPAERHLEGGFWLLHVDSEAFEVPENLVHATSEYEAGWLVVRARWFALHQRSPRGYRVPAEDRGSADRGQHHDQDAQRHLQRRRGREAPSRVALGAAHPRGGHVQSAVGECLGAAPGLGLGLT